MWHLHYFRLNPKKTRILILCMGCDTAVQSNMFVLSPQPKSRWRQPTAAPTNFLSSPALCIATDTTDSRCPLALTTRCACQSPGFRRDASR